SILAGVVGAAVNDPAHHRLEMDRGQAAPRIGPDRATDSAHLAIPSAPTEPARRVLPCRSTGQQSGEHTNQSERISLVPADYRTCHGLAAIAIILELVTPVAHRYDDLSPC